MRHLVRGRKLGRTASHRNATLMALSVALIKNERIVTTLAKAKALRSYVEPIITRAKNDNTHNRSHAFRHLMDNKATSRLFDEIGPLVNDRPGGYTRIVKLGVRPGDGAEKALIELVDFNESGTETPGRKKRRTRRGGSGSGKSKVSGKETATVNKVDSSKKKDVKEDVKKKEKASTEEPDGGSSIDTEKKITSETSAKEVKKVNSGSEKKSGAKDNAKAETAEKADKNISDTVGKQGKSTENKDDGEGDTASTDDTDTVTKKKGSDENSDDSK